MAAEPSPLERLHREQQIIKRLMALVTVILVAGALKWTTAVTMPLAFALFLVAVFWPLQRYLEQRMARVPATLLTLLAFFAVIGLFVGSLWLSIELVEEKAEAYKEEFTALYQELQHWVAEHGLQLGDETDVDSGQGQQGSAMSKALPTVLPALGQWVSSFVSGLTLVIAFFVLGLVDVHAFWERFGAVLSTSKSTQWLKPIERMVNDFQRYIVVRTVVGLITGIAIWIFCTIADLDFAFVWGFLNFVLNYIPTLGSIIGVIPVSAFALMQFGFSIKALIVFLGTAGIQILMGTYIDPLLQGKRLDLSPLVVLFSVVLWGWIWGIPGAFIGIPITLAVVIIAREFPRTRWISGILANVSARREDRD